MIGPGEIQYGDALEQPKLPEIKQEEEENHHNQETL